MTKVNIRTVSYDEWQKRMFEALKDFGLEQWVGYEKAKKQVEKDLERESQVEELKGKYIGLVQDFVEEFLSKTTQTEWGSEIKPEEGERLALDFFLKLKEKVDAGE
jgi:hypothetical protein